MFRVLREKFQFITKIYIDQKKYLILYVVKIGYRSIYEGSRQYHLYLTLETEGELESARHPE